MTIAELIEKWLTTAAVRGARAKRLGECRSGLEAATEAGIYRDCARELLAVITHEEEIFLTEEPLSADDPS